MANKCISINFARRWRYDIFEITFSSFCSHLNRCSNCVTCLWHRQQTQTFENRKRTEETSFSRFNLEHFVFRWFFFRSFVCETARSWRVLRNRWQLVFSKVFRFAFRFVSFSHLWWILIDKTFFGKNFVMQSGRECISTATDLHRLTRWLTEWWQRID